MPEALNQVPQPSVQPECSHRAASAYQGETMRCLFCRAITEPFILKKVQWDGWYKAIGRFRTLIDATERAAQQYGLYSVVKITEDGDYAEDFKPVSVRTAWFPVEGERRAVIVDPNREDPEKQRRLDALYDAPAWDEVA